MRYFSPIILTVLIFIVCFSCNESVRNEEHSTLKRNNKTDSIIVERQTILTPREDAIHLLNTYYLIDLRNFHYYNDSLLIRIQQNNHYYTDPYDKALSVYYKGVLLASKNLYELAIESLHESEEIALNQGWYHLLGMIYLQSAEIFRQLILYNTSVEYAEKSFNSFTLAKDSLLANRALGTKVLSLLELKKYEEANTIYEITKEYAMISDDIDYYRNLCGEKIIIHFIDGDKLLVDETYRDIIKIKDFKPTQPIEFIYLASKYISDNHLDSAFVYLAEADKKALSLHEKILLRSTFSDYYKKKKDYQTALEYVDKYISVFDSLITHNQRSSLINLESRERNLKLQLEYEKTNQAKKNLTYSVIISVFLLLSAFIFLFRKIAKQKKEINHKLALMSTLNESNETLLSRLNLQEEKEKQLKEEIEAKLNYAKMFAELYNKFPNKPGTILKKMGDLLDLVPTNHDFSTNIIHCVDVYYNNAMQRLAKKHSDLIESETLLCALIIAGFSVQEMGLILGCNSVDAIYARKYRLKQKLGLEKDVDIDNYLNKEFVE